MINLIFWLTKLNHIQILLPLSKLINPQDGFLGDNAQKCLDSFSLSKNLVYEDDMVVDKKGRSV